MACLPPDRARDYVPLSGELPRFGSSWFAMVSDNVHAVRNPPRTLYRLSRVRFQSRVLTCALQIVSCLYTPTHKTDPIDADLCHNPAI